MSVKTEQVETPNPNVGSYDAEGDGSFNIDDLIPEELRIAADALESNKTEEDAEVATHPPLVAKGEENEEEEGEESDESEKSELDNESEEEGEGTEYLDDDDVDLSDENLEKLLGGDLDAISKKGTEDEETGAPTWHTHEGYKDLVSKASYAGFDNDKFDKLIQEISDSKVIENGTYTKGLETKVAALETSRDTNASEVARLREVERLAHFDTSEEVQAKYADPMSSAVKEMRGILELEGIPVTVNSVVAAKDRSSLSKLLEEYAIDDVSSTKLINHWKNYRQLEKDYVADKNDARTNLGNHLSTQISDENANTIVRASLSQFMESDPKHAYIKEAILTGLDKQPEVSTVLSRAKSNFLNTVRALGNPSDYVHNGEWLSGLSSFMLDASHNRHMADKYVAMEKEHNETQHKLVRVVKAYRRLAKSAKGLEGSGSGAGLRGSPSNGTSTDGKQDLEEFMGVLSGAIKLEDIGM